MTDFILAFKGFDHLLNGVMIPFCVALGACLARVAFFGWDGFKSFAANFTISFVLGMGAHWYMLDTSLGGSTRAAITLGVALISKNVLDALFSHKTRAAMHDRISWELRHRFARPPRHAPSFERGLPPDMAGEMQEDMGEELEAGAAHDR